MSNSGLSFHALERSGYPSPYSPSVKNAEWTSGPHFPRMIRLFGALARRGSLHALAMGASITMGVWFPVPRRM